MGSGNKSRRQKKRRNTRKSGVLGHKPTTRPCLWCHTDLNWKRQYKRVPCQFCDQGVDTTTMQPCPVCKGEATVSTGMGMLVCPTCGVPYPKRAFTARIDIWNKMGAFVEERVSQFWDMLIDDGEHQDDEAYAKFLGKFSLEPGWWQAHEATPDITEAELQAIKQQTLDAVRGAYLTMAWNRYVEGVLPDGG